jgi:hypothetical protein
MVALLVVMYDGRVLQETSGLTVVTLLWRTVMEAEDKSDVERLRSEAAKHEENAGIIRGRCHQNRARMIFSRWNVYNEN